MRSLTCTTRYKLSRQAAGFTLIELLIASSILALTTLTSWRGVDMVLRTQTRIVTSERITENVEKTFEQLDIDTNNIATLQNKRIDSLNLYTTGFALVRKKSSNQDIKISYQVISYIFNDAELWRVTSPILSTEEEIIEALKDLSTYSVSGKNIINNNNPKKINQARMMQGVSDIDINIFFQKGWQPRQDYNFLIAQEKLENRITKSEGIKFRIIMEGGEEFKKTVVLKS